MKVFKSLLKWSFIAALLVLLCFRITAQVQLGPDSTQLIVEDRINCQIFRTAKKYGGLSISGQGGLNDIMLDKVREKTYYFDSKKELNVDKGREYMVKLILDTLRIYNNERLYRKYFFEYPFKPKNLNLAIFSKSAKAKDRNLPKITGVSFRLNHLYFNYLTKITGESGKFVDSFETDYERKRVKEGFRVALNKVKETLSTEQIETANSLDLLDGNLNDEETSGDREYRSEIDSKELWNLYHQKEYREGRISIERLNQILNYQKSSKLNKWEKDIVFPDEKSKALYQKKVEYLKGEKEWEN